MIVGALSRSHKFSNFLSTGCGEVWKVVKLLVLLGSCIGFLKRWQAVGRLWQAMASMVGVVVSGRPCGSVRRCVRRSPKSLWWQSTGGNGSERQGERERHWRGGDTMAGRVTGLGA